VALEWSGDVEGCDDGGEVDGLIGGNNCGSNLYLSLNRSQWLAIRHGSFIRSFPVGAGRSNETDIWRVLRWRNK